ncbi:MAG: isoaspartyl peptidase/L-asparaginase [Cyanobacteria bacterium P01_H01_bin.130]
MSGLSVAPRVIIHGGAGGSLKSKGGVAAVRAILQGIVTQVYGCVTDGGSATDAVVLGCRLLEDEPRFNAGTGSVLQSDGQIRMSSALMDGQRLRFSGVINTSGLKNPIEVAQFLQGERDRVLSDVGAGELLRELQVPVFNPLTDLRLKEWMEERKGGFERTMASTLAEPQGDEAGRGTIGVVVLDGQGNVAAGTSTGGKGFERVGRVSDSAMPAGNYANAIAGVSCTGIGEDIIDECLAAKIVIRTTDGMSIQASFEKSIAEATANGRDLGAIGLDRSGAIAWGKTSEVLVAAYHDGNRIGDTLELGDGMQVGGCGA